MKISKSKISVSEYYEKFREGERLKTGMGKLEFERTKDILLRFLPAAPATVLDVGGGTGPYSYWLAKRGYRVHLVEPSSRLIEEARQLGENRLKGSLFSCHQGDARALDFPDDFADAVLLSGPLYHLTERKDRRRALGEAYRVLQKNGLLFCAAISRFASAIDGLARRFFEDTNFFAIIKQDLRDGQHRNPTAKMDFFTDAYFHRPADLKEELMQAGFTSCQLFPVEGLGIFLCDFDEVWNEEGLRPRLLDIIALTEPEESILGVSPHLLGVARKPAQIYNRAEK
jgi:ubiquinone/menaquinone biosynthesis C-methylase UbiE